MKFDTELDTCNNPTSAEVVSFGVPALLDPEELDEDEELDAEAFGKGMFWKIVKKMTVMPKPLIQERNVM
jgi:hypothetical protein